jgi:predicted RNA-binding protein YlxR (DUF448 family)
MTTKRAQELRPQVIKELNTLLKVDKHKNGRGVFISLGKDYLRTLEGSNIFSTKCAVKVAAGTPGKRLADLYNWLYEASSSRGRQLVAKQLNDNIHIRGIKITLEREEVLNAARRAIKNGFEDRACYHSWYVLVDRHRLSPKWIIHILTGLPFGSFHTDEARRVLSQLGIKVHAA